jgi:dCMP deaminase
MFLPWFPCMDCARAIVQSGISELIATSPDFVDEKWGVEFRSAITLFEECGVKVRFLSADKVIENT